MPWTFAHPAAVLPLRRLGRLELPLAALVIGSLAPDMGYYAGQYPFAALAHTPWGWLVVCVPLGLLVGALWRRVRQPLAGLLPQPHRSALVGVCDAATLTAAPGLPVSALAVLLGAATHAAWDACTHETGAVVQQLALLQTPLFSALGPGVPVYNLLQHTSTLVGVTVLGIVYTRWLRRQPAAVAHVLTADDRARYRRLGGALLASLAVSVPGLVLLAGGDVHPASWWVVRTVVCTTTVYGLVLLVWSLRAAAYAERDCSA